jgi:hypothetical protein
VSGPAAADPGGSERAGPESGGSAGRPPGGLRPSRPPTPNPRVRDRRAHYSARLGSNGAEFDSSYAKKQPLILKVTPPPGTRVWCILHLAPSGGRGFCRAGCGSGHPTILPSRDPAARDLPPPTPRPGFPAARRARGDGGVGPGHPRRRREWRPRSRAPPLRRMRGERGEPPPRRALPCCPRAREAHPPAIGPARRRLTRHPPTPAPAARQGIPPMREGGKRRIVVPPGPLQQQGTKSLVWMVGLLDALEEAGGEWLHDSVGPVGRSSGYQQAVIAGAGEGGQLPKAPNPCTP